MIDRNMLGLQVGQQFGLNNKTVLTWSYKSVLSIVNATFRKIDWSTPKIKKELYKFLQPSIRITTSTVGSDYLFFGSSKAGGKADFSTDKLPSFLKDKNYNLLYQINLEDIASYDFHPLLPKNGIIYFFLDTSNVNQAIKTHYSNDVKVNQHQFTAGFKLLFYPIYTFPHHSSDKLEPLNLKYKEDKENIELFAASLNENLEITWTDTLLFPEPIPLQNYPFISAENDTNNCLPLLDFAYHSSKYHVGIKKEDLQQLNFTEILFNSATT